MGGKYGGPIDGFAQVFQQPDADIVQKQSSSKDEGSMKLIWQVALDKPMLHEFV